MIAVSFEIYLREPLLATTLQGDPNSAVSLPFIPGSALRGALMTRYLAGHPLQDAAVDSDCRRIFLDGHTRYLHAYPLTRLKGRMLPTPLSWKVEKGSTQPVYDLSVEPPDPDLELRPVQEPYCWLDRDAVEFCTPARRVSVHTQRDRRMGRAVEGVGAVFRYEALAPWQTFRGVILCAAESDAQLVRSLLEEGDLSLGGSRSAGYGLAGTGEAQVLPDWQESSMILDDVPEGGELLITLLSDALLRDDAGQDMPYVSADYVGARLAARVDPVRDRTYSRPVIVGGFNRKWGLPLPQMAAARAGSVYVFRAQDAISADRLARLAAAGIGERRAEGFGRLAVNWHARHGQLKRRPVPEPPTVGAPSVLSGVDASLALRMAERMLRGRVDRALLALVNRTQVAYAPKNSQLSRLHVIVRSALPGADVARVRRYLEELRPTARRQFEAARVGGDTLLDWLKGRLARTPDQMWHELGLASSDLPRVGDVQAVWGEDMAHEYALRLIDGVLARVMHERRE